MSDDALRASGGFCAPQDPVDFAKRMAADSDVPFEALFHCELCARYPVRLWYPSMEVFYVVHEQERGLRRLISKLLRMPTEWHRVEFFPKLRLADVLPAFTAARGGISYS